MSSHLNSVFDNHKRMQSVYYKLNRLGESFAATGNDKVAIQLFDIADDVISAAEDVRSSFGSDQDKRWKETQQSTANILSALVAGVEMGKASSS